MTDTDDIQPRTGFDLLGGQPVIDRLVDGFYDRMDSLPQARDLRARHLPFRIGMADRDAWMRNRPDEPPPGR
jgi:truncated hemoglobin YjbI